MRVSRLFLPFIPLIFLAAACNLLQTEQGTQTPPTLAATSAPATIAPQATIESPGSQPVASDSPLRLWIPPEIGARTEAGAQELLSQIRAFETGHNNIGVTLEQKPIEGAGGMLNYLQTGRTVAPSIMPDLVAIPTSLLVESRYRDLFYPLEGLIDPTFVDQIYTAPASQVVNNNQIIGYPFATAGLTHLLYNPSVITETLPLRWTQLISDMNHTLVFPADSREGAMLGLQFYLAEGGTLADSTGKPALDAEPLARALAAIGTRKENLLQSHQLKTLDEAWQYHQLGLSDFMWMRSDYLLGRQAIDPSLMMSQVYAAVPGVSGALIPLTTSWAWAVTTNDPTRQALAADLILYLTTPDNLANWSSRSQVFPAHRSAMAMLGDQNPYMNFAAGELERSQPMPVAETSKLMDVIGDAVFQVLTTEISPVLIAEQAATALRQ